MAKAAKTRDEIVSELLAKVNEKRAEIAQAEAPTWHTNCSFSFTQSGTDRTNIQTVQDVNVLISMLAHLYKESDYFAKAATEMGVKAEFTWFGKSLNDWVSDLKTRSNKIQISKKKKELEEFEERLNKLISPAERERMELEALQKSIENL